MRLIILTQYYLPETGAPQNRLSDLARRLHTMGHEVTVLTAKPNYPRGEFFRGYRGGILKRRKIEGVDVSHCWLYPTKSKRVALRLLNYFSFVFSSGLLGALTLRKADVLLVESPPIFLGVTAVWLARLKGARVVFNVSDLYPETAIALGYLEQPSLQKVFYKLEAWCYEKSMLVTGQTEGIVNSIRSRFPKQPVFLMTNGVDVDKFPSRDAPGEARGAASAEPFVVGYAGIHGHAQKLESVLEAARLLPTDANIRIEFYGDGPLREDLQNRAREWGLDHVKFGGHRSHSEVVELMAGWDAGLVPLMDAPVMAGALPSKMFEVMARHLPVLLSSPKGEASALIERAGAGMWVPAEKPQELADALMNMVNNREESRVMGDNARRYVLEHYNRAEIAKQFVAEVDRLLKNRGKKAA